MGILPGEAPLQQNSRKPQANKGRLLQYFFVEYINQKMKKLKVLNICKHNIYKEMTFMFKIKRDTASVGFRNNFREISHQYPTEFSQSDFLEGNILSDQTKIGISSQGPTLWKRLLNQEKKA